MADRDTEVSYAEMVRRQAAEDVARWRARGKRPPCEMDRIAINDGKGGWVVWQLVGVFDDRQKALDACTTSERSAA
jgi:hypothetical protein